MIIFNKIYKKLFSICYTGGNWWVRYDYPRTMDEEVGNRSRQSTCWKAQRNGKQPRNMDEGIDSALWTSWWRTSCLRIVTGWRYSVHCMIWLFESNILVFKSMHIKGNEVTNMYVLVFTQRINVLVIVNQTDHIDI